MDLDGLVPGNRSVLNVKSGLSLVLLVLSLAQGVGVVFHLAPQSLAVVIFDWVGTGKVINRIFKFFLGL